MINTKPLFKRICAYIIDLFIIIILVNLITKLPLFDKYMDKYQKTYDEYLEKYNNYSEYVSLLEESYNDKELTEEEYNKLLEKEQYLELIIPTYEDNTVTKEEYNNLVENITKDFDTVAKDYVYQLNKEGIFNSVITLTLTLIYFGIIQYLLKGQTLGKKLLKLRVVSASNKKITILNYLLRSLIINEVLLNGISILFISFATKSIYLKADSIISTLITVIEAIIIFLIATREDRRGLHDLLFNTKVIVTNEPIDKSQEETQVIEANYEEKKEPKEPTKKTTNKAKKATKSKTTKK